MVKKGNYIARLVEAESKNPFKEFVIFDADTGDMHVFAEVEPGQNWYIETEVCGEEEEDVNFRFKVDGKDLGYNATQHKSEGARTSGMWYCNGENEIERALEFTAPVRAKSDGGDDAPSTNGQAVPICPAMDMMGKVEINVYQAIDMYVVLLFLLSPFDHRELAHNFVQYFRGVQVHAEREVVLPSSLTSNFEDAKSKGKMLRSCEGTVCIESKSDSNESSHNYDCGELLESITIHYCTAVGLVKAGVLGRPKDHRGECGANESQTCHKSEVPSRKKRKIPEIIHQSAEYDENGDVAIPAKVIEVFDLT